MLLGDFKTLADWMTALIERMEGTRSFSFRINFLNHAVSRL